LRPEVLVPITDIHFFKQGIRPVWEHEKNESGGKWIIRLKKGLAGRMWENLLLAVIGGEFNQECSEDLCGLVLSVRAQEDIISIWNGTSSVPRINLMIKDTIKSVLSLPTETVMEYKAHKDAIHDQSSFRNTDVFR
jgi:translation initiation factor 4E